MGTTVDGRKRTNSRYRAPEGPTRDYYGGGWKSIGWSGSHERPVEAQRKQAVELCDVPEQPISRYHTDILYDDKPVGVIWFGRGRWRVMIGQHEYGPFKTYLGARKYVYLWFSGLDIVPLDENGRPE